MAACAGVTEYGERALRSLDLEPSLESRVTERTVIAGAGHAAGQVIATLKQQQYAGHIVLVGDEDYLPYQRPPLSKKFLAGALPAERLHFKPASFYDDPRIEVRLQTTITTIDRDKKSVHTEGGESISYDKLVLALGSRARRLTVEGANLAGVHYLRSIKDVDDIRAELNHARRAVIIGAGYIGLEVAAVMQQQGLDVTVVELADRVMSRVVSPEISDFYQIEHANQGVKLRLSTGVPADFVIVGIGIVANTELAASAGLSVDNGIVVDDRCQTSDPAVYAIGDCTAHPNIIYDRQIRLESVHNALEQAKTAAANICGKETHYAQVPWFWSDQYDLKLQIAGLSEGYDEIVIRGNPANRSFACLYLKNGRLIATDAVNAPREFVQSKDLIASHAKIESARLADTEIPLRDAVV
jgi:3-phenylpropionate/trans-cinnamate dioxygenase ferredoxin reductase subunit